MFKLNDVNYKKFRKAIEKEHDKKIKALDELFGRDGSSKFDLKKIGASSISVNRPQYGALKKSVADTVEKTTTEFTVRDIWESLKETGIKYNVVSTALIRLAEDGLIEVSHQGSGRFDPTTYKRKTKASGH